MPVDDVNLGKLVTSLRGLAATYDQRRRQALDILAGLEKIELHGDGTIPLDADTGQTMTQARRDEIYDKCLAPAEALLGINQTEDEETPGT